MGILIKYTLRNIKTHKFRTFLIALSIMLSVALFFGSLSISDALSQIVMDNIKTYLGTAEIYATAGYGEGGIKIKPLGEAGKNVEYSVGVVEFGISYANREKKKENIQLKGYRLEDLEKMNPIKYEKFLGKENFRGKAAIVGMAFAKKEGLDINDMVKLQFSEDDIKLFRIVGIAKDQGFFKGNVGFGEKSTEIIVPRETLSRYLGSPNMMNIVYFKTVDDTKAKETVEEIKTVYKNSSVGFMVTKSEIDNQIRPVRIPFLFMLILVVMISIFIIYTSFKVITLERLPMLGTFRSIGATKKMTNFIMISEAAIYGVLSSALGCALGHVLLNVLMKLIAEDMAIEKIVYPPTNMIGAFFFGLTLAVASAVIPIVKASKVPVKEILLNVIEGTKKKKRYVRYLVGTVLAVISILAPLLFSEGTAAALSGGLSIVFMIFAWVAFVPLLTDTFIRLSEKGFGIVFGNIGRLSVKNMKGSKSTYDNVILLSIGLASVLTISVMASGISKDMVSYFDAKNYDIDLLTDSLNRTSEQRVLSVDGVSDSITYKAVYRVYGYKDDKTDFARKILGIRDEKTLEFFSYDILNTEQDEDIFLSVLKGRNIILGTAIRDRYNFHVGQEIVLKTDKGNRDYKIVGFIQTKESNGKLAIVSVNNLKGDLRTNTLDSMAIRVQSGYDVDKVFKKVEDKFKNKDWVHIETIKEQKERGIKSNRSLVMIISIFSFATALIGSVGLMNNFLVNFLARKKDLAIYASVGMSRKQKMFMLVIEAVSSGIIGGIFGLITTKMILFRVGILLQKVEMNLPMEMDLSAGIKAVLGAIVICLLASISAISRSRKISVIEELRYE